MKVEARSLKWKQKLVNKWSVSVNWSKLVLLYLKWAHVLLRIKQCPAVVGKCSLRMGFIPAICKNLTLCKFHPGKVLFLIFFFFHGLQELCFSFCSKFLWKKLSSDGWHIISALLLNCNAVYHMKLQKKTERPNLNLWTHRSIYEYLKDILVQITTLCW